MQGLSFGQSPVGALCTVTVGGFSTTIAIKIFTRVITPMYYRKALGSMWQPNRYQNGETRLPTGSFPLGAA